MGGAASVTIAANKGIKMDIARKVEAADHYLDLERDRDAAKQQWAKLKEDNPCTSFYFLRSRQSMITNVIDGFDVVVEATGVESLVNDAINYVSRGGTLLVYGVYADAARVSWSPTKIFVDEIKYVPRPNLRHITSTDKAHH